MSQDSLSPAARYALDASRPGFLPDPTQQRAMDALEQLYQELLAKPPKHRLGSPRLRWPAVKGLYLWGGVGRGKTYLLDTFFASLPFTRKQRTHFHRFMLEVHQRRQHFPAKQDPLVCVADEIAARVRVLCFDEFFVADIADAMILGRLFEALFKRGVTLVTTSNVPPDLLYRDGLQRERFLPAIEMLKQNVRLLEVDNGTDYRLRALDGFNLYLVGSEAANETSLRERFDSVATGVTQEQADLHLNDRVIQAEALAPGVAWFSFAALCEGPRSAADYVELAHQYHTLVLSGVPQMGSDREDAARRFLTLIDELYDRGTKIVVGAAVPIESLYAGRRLSFEFERTRSRLIEMQSREYLARPHLA